MRRNRPRGRSPRKAIGRHAQLLWTGSQMNADSDRENRGALLFFSRRDVLSGRQYYVGLAQLLDNLFRLMFPCSSWKVLFALAGGDTLMAHGSGFVEHAIFTAHNCCSAVFSGRTGCFYKPTQRACSITTIGSRVINDGRSRRPQPEGLLFGGSSSVARGENEGL